HHLMARLTEFSGPELLEVEPCRVDRLPRRRLAGRRFEFMLFLLGDRLSDPCATARAIDRLVYVARDDVAFAVGLAVRLANSMAGDAGHPFAGDLWHFPER